MLIENYSMLPEDWKLGNMHQYLKKEKSCINNYRPVIALHVFYVNLLDPS